MCACCTGADAEAAQQAACSSLPRGEKRSLDRRCNQADSAVDAGEPLALTASSSGGCSPDLSSSEETASATGEGCIEHQQAVMSASRLYATERILLADCRLRTDKRLLDCLLE